MLVSVSVRHRSRLFWCPLRFILGERGLGAGGDQEARTRLIQANLRLVVTVAKEYTHHGVSLGDLIGEGNLGLLRALERFDPGLRFRFVSYKAKYEGQMVDGDHEAIISPVTFGKVQKALKRRAKRR